MGMELGLSPNSKDTHLAKLTLNVLDDALYSAITIVTINWTQEYLAFCKNNK